MPQNSVVTVGTYFESNFKKKKTRLKIIIWSKRIVEVDIYSDKTIMCGLYWFILKYLTLKVSAQELIKRF